jgi:hypothetical protein
MEAGITLDYLTRLHKYYKEAIVVSNTLFYFNVIENGKNLQSSYNTMECFWFY